MIPWVTKLPWLENKRNNSLVISRSFNTHSTGPGDHGDSWLQCSLQKLNKIKFIFCEIVTWYKNTTATGEGGGGGWKMEVLFCNRHWHVEEPSLLWHSGRLSDQSAKHRHKFSYFTYNRWHLNLSENSQQDIKKPYPNGERKMLVVFQGQSYTFIGKINITDLLVYFCLCV